MSQVNYIKAQSFNRANVEDGLWYAQTEADKATLLANEKLAFGDKVYVIATKQVYIIGIDGQWWPM